MKKHRLFKLSIMFLVIVVPIFGYFVWQTRADTTINKTLNTLDLQQGLVGHWTFDGPNLKQNAADSSGQGNTGYLTSFTSTTTVVGKLGQALQFDGSNDRVNINTTTGVDTLSTVTISAWIYPKSYGGGNFSRIYSKGTGGLNTDKMGFFLDNNGTAPDATLRGFIGYTTVANVTSGQANWITLNQWQHVVMTWDGSTVSTGIKFYRNGIESSSYGDNSNASGSRESDTGQAANIGDRTDGSRAFNGSIDDVRIYNRALSPAEITQLYNLGATTKIATSINAAGCLQTGLVDWWTFDGPDLKQNAADSSGQGNTGYLTNFTSTTTVAGRIGQALSFDGVDDYVEYTSNIAFNSNDFSVAGWFKLAGDAGGTDGDAVIFLQRVDTAGNANPTVGLFVRNTDDKLRGQIRDNVGAIVDKTGTTLVAKNVWYHGAMVKTSSTLTLYVNGVNDGSASHTLSGDFDAGAVYRFLGKSRYSGADKGFLNGHLDDVRVYNRALSAEEITRLYKLGGTTHINKTLNTLDLANGLVGYWTFDGKNLTQNAPDSSGQGNTGYLTSFTSTTTVVGKLGQALQFDGVDDYVNMGDVLDFNRTEARTITAWIKANTLSGGAGVNAIITKEDMSAPFSGWGFEISDSGRLRFEYIVTNSPSNYLQTKTANVVITTKKWYHVTVVYDNISTTFYVNGAAQSGSVINNTLTSNINTTWGTNIGGRDNGGGDFFDGLIDDVRIYNRALGAEEIKRLYELGH